MGLSMVNCVYERGSDKYTRVQKNRPLLIIKVLNLAPLILNLENLKLVLRESVHCSLQRNRNRVKKIKEMFTKVNCILIDIFVRNVYFTNLCFQFSTPPISDPLFIPTPQC